MNTFRRLAAALIAPLALCAAAFAQDDPVTVTATAAGSGNAPPGGVVAVRVDVDVDPAFHIYGLAQTQDAVPPSFKPGKGGWPAGFTAGSPSESPAPETETVGGISLLIHRGKVSFTLPFTLAADVKPGPHEVSGDIELQVCDETSCLVPKLYPFTASVYVTEPSTVTIARAAFVPASASPGSTATIEIELAIGKGWHVYGQTQEMEKPPKFKWTLPEGWTTSGGIVEVTPPHDAKLFGLEDSYSVHEGRAVLRQAFAIPAGAPLGNVEIKGLGNWQRCDDAGCTDDVDVPVAATLAVVAPGSAPAPAPAQQGKPLPQPSEDADPASSDGEAGDLWGVILSGMGWGLITILTPCVFPLLPVTVSFFSKQKGPALPRSTIYALGIIFTITVIGLIFKASLDSMARGSLFNLAVAVLFIVLALSLFGLFELRLPSFLIDKSQEKSQAGGLWGAFFMAVTLALTSFSCSVPFLAIMFSRFDQGAVVQSVIGLLAYSATVALPFFLCSLFPTLLKAMPRSGGWLNAVKVTMGFVEFGLAFKFLRTVALNEGSDVLSRSLVLAIWTACAIGAAIYLFGYLTLPHDTKVESIGVMRLMFALLFLTMAMYFVPGVFGRPLNPTIDGFIQTQASDLVAQGAPGSEGGGEAETHWPRDDWNGALARAAEKRRPALFDFTGVG